VELQPGQLDQGLRVIDFRAVEQGWALTVEGLPGRSYPLRLRGERPRQVIGAALGNVEDAGGPMELVIAFQAGEAGPIRSSITIER
jgi:hypothetical protein